MRSAGKSSRSKEIKIVSIGKAADFLGVSVDTVRRWDKAGKLHSKRLDGKNRYFSVRELEEVKGKRGVSIGEAARQLELSAATLRRLEEKELIRPERNRAGERMYTKETIEEFLKSEYWLKQKKQLREKTLRSPLGKMTVETANEMRRKEGTAEKKNEQEGLKMGIREMVRDLVSLMTGRRMIYLSGGFLVTAWGLLVIEITISFLIFPGATADFFGYQGKPVLDRVDQGQRIEVVSAEVLGARVEPMTGQDARISWAGRTLKPVSKVSLWLVRVIDPNVYSMVVSGTRTEYLNDYCL